MRKPLRLLLVEECDDDDASQVLRDLEAAGYDVSVDRVRGASAFRDALGAAAWDGVVAGTTLPPLSMAGARPLDEKGTRDRALFDASPQPMWVFDLDTLAFLEVNESACRHYGYTRDEFLAMTLADIRPAKDVAALVQDIARHEDDPHRVWVHRKKDGALISVEVKAHDFDIEGRRGRLVLVNDVTERIRSQDALRRTEEQLRHAQKMEAVGRLAGGIAHDFNNMLSVILSYTSMILEDAPSEDPARVDLQEVQRAAERATALTRQLLAFSRQQVLAPQLLDPNEVLANLDRLLRPLLGADVEVVRVAGPSLDKVLIDRGQLEQVIVNLAVNARDAMPTGGTLILETANVNLDEEYARDHLGATAGPHVLIAVSDTGIGMDQATEARIFEPFFTTKEVGKGTGLGLATVFGIVKQAGGSIWVYSEEGHGTTFKIYLPRANAGQPIAPTTTLRAAPHGGNETILLVEDEPQVRAVARDILRRQGYEVLEAANAVDAFRFFDKRAKPIHLLLVDVILPRVSGADLAKRLAARDPKMRILFMSGYTGEAAAHQGVPAPVHYLQKPITPDALCRKVREVLDAGAPPSRR